MDYIDYYKVLGIQKSATDADIKKAFRKQARKYHPDVNPDDKSAETKFKEVNEANEVLGNAENRKKYDQYGKDWKHAEEYEKAKQQQQYRGSQQSAGGDFGGGDYSDFFESMFGSSFSGARGNGGGSRRQFKGQDFNATLALNIHDVFTSNQRVLTVNGKSIRLTIPAGVKNGQVIKISGHGGDGANGGPKGDLYITFAIENNTKFKLDNDNLYATVDLDVYLAMLGGDLTVDTFDGQVKLKVAAETQNGTKVKLKGKGFPVYKKEGAFGDLFITYQIQLPTGLTEKEKELVAELRKLRTS